MIIRHFFEGGSYFMFWIYLMWIIVLIQSVRFIILYRSNKDPQKLKWTNDSILFVGSLGFLIGALAQMLGLVSMFDSIQIADSVVPALIAGGLKVSFIPPFYGLVLLIVSSIIWFVSRNFLLPN